ncbi:MAG: hypothetical protein ACFFKA_00270 [Candidatus Thorarchaeota archaeon]
MKKELLIILITFVILISLYTPFRTGFAMLTGLEAQWALPFYIGLVVVTYSNFKNLVAGFFKK